MGNRIYNLNGKKILIPQEDIDRSMKVLKLTEQEAIQVWLEDEGYLDNEEQNELEEKAKNSKITATIHGATATAKKKTQRERVKREDATKEEIIAKIAEILEKNYENVQILNKTKLISFQLGDDSFKIDLIRTRKDKKST